MGVVMRVRSGGEERELGGVVGVAATGGGRASRGALRDSYGGRGFVRDAADGVVGEDEAVAPDEEPAIGRARLKRGDEPSLDEPADGSVRGVLRDAELVGDVANGCNRSTVPVAECNEHLERRPRRRADLAAHR